MCTLTASVRTESQTAPISVCSAHKTTHDICPCAMLNKRNNHAKVMCEFYMSTMAVTMIMTYYASGDDKHCGLDKDHDYDHDHDNDHDYGHDYDHDYDHDGERCGERWSRGRTPDCQSRGRFFDPTYCRFET